MGAVQLQLNILSCLYYQIKSSGEASIALTLYTVLFTWFIAEYMFFENVHLYTYDLFAEKIGFKLVWGCLAFYPFFYPLNAYFLARLPKDTDINNITALGIAVLFFIGWMITRGANMQKYYFRVHPERVTFFFGLFPQNVIPNSRILCSGFWGASRHFNYFGEILQAIALALPLFLISQSNVIKGVSLLYPLYYILLFVPRQMDDDAICKMKYGKLWDEYEKRVPWRIVPFIY